MSLIFNLLVPLFRPSPFRVVLFFYITIYGSSHCRFSVEKGILKNLKNFTGKHLFWSIFLIKLQALACNFIKKRLQHRFFSVKFAKLLRTPILKKICERLLLNLSGIPRASMKRFQRNIQMELEKPIFKITKRITRSNILNGK